MFGQQPISGETSSIFGGFGTNNSTTAFGSSSFGMQTTASGTPFGSETVTSKTNPFGQTKPSTKELFGSSQSSGFGSISSKTNSFGQTKPSTTDLFGSSQPSGFGSTRNSYGNGGGLFGTSNTQTSNTGGGLFGNNTGNSIFNTSQNQTRPFSFDTASTSSTGTSSCGTDNNSSGANLFSSALGRQGSVTVIKFNPVLGTDLTTQGGATTKIQTKIEVITAMMEYENSSLEELRIEDYLAGRKSPKQQGFGFGQIGRQNKFGLNQPATSSNWFSGSNKGSGGGIFGTKPPENKTLFGTNQPTGFGTSTSGGGGLFGTSNPAPFGLANKTSSTGFSFDQNRQQKKERDAGIQIKFNPVEGSETMFTGGTVNVYTNINITGMKEENESIEELRVKDYLKGMKGDSSCEEKKFKFGFTPHTAESHVPNTGYKYPAATGGSHYFSKPQKDKLENAKPLTFSFAPSAPELEPKLRVSQKSSLQERQPPVFNSNHDDSLFTGFKFPKISSVEVKEEVTKQVNAKFGELEEHRESSMYNKIVHEIIRCKDEHIAELQRTVYDLKAENDLLKSKKPLSHIDSQLTNKLTLTENVELKSKVPPSHIDSQLTNKLTLTGNVEMDNVMESFNSLKLEMLDVKNAISKLEGAVESKKKVTVSDSVVCLSEECSRSNDLVGSVNHNRCICPLADYSGRYF